MTRRPLGAFFGHGQRSCLLSAGTPRMGRGDGGVVPPATGTRARTRRDARGARDGGDRARSDRRRGRRAGSANGSGSDREDDRVLPWGRRLLFSACLSGVDGLGALREYASRQGSVPPPDAPVDPTRWDRVRARALTGCLRSVPAGDPRDGRGRAAPAHGAGTRGRCGRRRREPGRGAPGCSLLPSNDASGAVIGYAREDPGSHRVVWTTSREASRSPSTCSARALARARGAPGVR